MTILSRFIQFCTKTTVPANVAPHIERGIKSSALVMMMMLLRPKQHRYKGTEKRIYRIYIAQRHHKSRILAQ